MIKARQFAIVVVAALAAVLPLCVVRPAMAATGVNEQFGGNRLSTTWKQFDAQGCVDPANATVSGGSLHMKLVFDPGTGKYCGVRIGTARTFHYGTFQARIRFNLPTGSHNGFTMYGETGKPWPWNGEFDVAEELGRTPTTDHVRVWTQKLSSKTQARCGASADYRTPVPVNKQWHTYGVSWQPGKIAMLFDGKPILTFTAANAKAKGCYWPFDTAGYKMRPYLSTSVGGPYAGHPPTDGRGYPASTDVDWFTVS